MSRSNLIPIILVIAGGVVFIILLILKNRKDRKDIIIPRSDDPVQEEHTIIKNRDLHT